MDLALVVSVSVSPEVVSPLDLGKFYPLMVALERGSYDQ